MWLIFGFAGFNAASQLTISQPGDGYVVARATFNTFLACSSGGISSVIFIRFLPWWGRRWSYVNMVNGALSGMVYILTVPIYINEDDFSIISIVIQ
jgi:ammonia channel protein AmtB